MKRSVLCLFAALVIAFNLTGPALASHGYYNSRVLLDPTHAYAVLESNSWYTSNMPEMSTYSQHWSPYWATHGVGHHVFNMWRCHVDRWHWFYGIYGVYWVQGTHTFWAHNTIYTRYSGPTNGPW